MKMNKIVSSLIAGSMFVMVMAGCSTASKEQTVAPAPAATAEEKATPESQSSKDKPYEIAVIVKATDSDFWQTLLLGATSAMKDNPDLVNVTTYGPPSEADIDQQVSILEDVVSRKPDAIVISSTSSDATVPMLDEAYAQGIPVITIDNKVNTESYHSFLATDNLKGGASAAEQMVESWEKAGIDPAGKKVAIISAMAGVQVLTDRDGGFTDKMKDLVPDIQFIETRYVDNDIVKALAATEDLLTANSDLIGVFADNNHTGVGASKAVSERNLQDKVMVYAFDADAEEISALDTGAIKGLVVQDPFGMGYKGTMFAVDVIEGREVPKTVDTGATIVTKDNINDSAIKKLLNPLGE